MIRAVSLLFLGFAVGYGIAFAVRQIVRAASRDSAAARYIELLRDRRAQQFPRDTEPDRIDQPTTLLQRLVRWMNT